MTAEELIATGLVLDSRVKNIRDPRALYPPFPMRILNASGEVIPYVFYLDLKTGRCGKYKSYMREDGYYLSRTYVNGVPGDMEEEWIELPGFKIERLVPKDLGKEFRKKKFK